MKLNNFIKFQLLTLVIYIIWLYLLLSPTAAHRGSGRVKPTPNTQSNVPMHIV